MKNHLKIILLCTIAIFVILILWFCDREKEPKPTSGIKSSATNVSSLQNVAVSREVEQQTNASASVTTIASPKSSQTNSVVPEEKLRALVENKNAPINFWGLVEDQDGNPLEGVKITGNTRTWYVTSTLNFDSRFPTGNAVSDSNGKFEIRNASGDVLTIKSMERRGRLLRSRQSKSKP